MGQLNNLYVSSSYQGLLKMTDSTTGVTGTLQTVQTGDGTNSPLQMSLTQVNISGSLTVNGAPISIDTGSFATTGSNTFVGKQTITGSNGSLTYDGTMLPDSTLASIHANDDQPWLERFYNDSFSTSSSVMSYFAWNDGRFIFHNESTQSISISTNGYVNDNLVIGQNENTSNNDLIVSGAIKTNGAITFSESAFNSTTNVSGALYFSSLNNGTLHLNDDGGEGDVFIGWGPNNTHIRGNTDITGSLIISGSEAVDLIVTGSAQIVSQDALAILTMAPNSFNVNTTGKQSTPAEGYIFGPTGSNAQFYLGVYDYPNFNTDVELNIKVDSNGISFNDWDNVTAGDYIPFMNIAPNLGNNPAPQMLRGLDITGSLGVTNIKGTGSLFLQPNQGDARFVEIYNTSPTDTHITASGGQIFLGNDVTYVKVDNYGSVNRIDVVADNELVVSSSIVNLSGSLHQSGTFYPDVIDWINSSILQNTGSYILTVNSSGVTQYDTYQNVAAELQPYINTGSFNRDGLITTGSAAQTQSITGSLVITENITANSASFNFLTTIYETASIIYSSGSNQFGDASNDTQTLWGTIKIPTGPVSLTGSLNVSGSGININSGLGSQIVNNITGRTMIYGGSGLDGQTPRLIISGSDNAKTTIGRGFYGVDVSNATGLGAQIYQYADPSVNVNYSQGVYNPNDGSDDVELSISTTTGGTQFQDYNQTTYEYEDFLFIPPNVNGSTPQFTKGLGVTGSLNVTNGITGSLQGTASFAISASYAPDGSNRNGLITTGSIAGSQSITGSLIISGSVNITGSVQGNINSLTIASTTASLNLNLGNFFTLQLVSGSNTRIEPSNIKQGQTINILLSTTGSATVSFPSTVLQISGSSYVPTTTTSKDIITLISFDNTNLYLANVKNLI